MGKIIKVNESACIGCGACIGIDSEHFDFSEQGFSKVISNNNLDSSALQDAIASCPVEAIAISTNECSNEDCHCDPCDCGTDCKCDGTECHCKDEKTA